MADMSNGQMIITWVADNKEWVFSGCGVAAITILGSWLFLRNKKTGKSAIVKKCDNAMQALDGGKNYSAGNGGTLIINNGISKKEFYEILSTYKEETEKRILEFRHELYELVIYTNFFQQKLSSPEIRFSIHNAEIQYVKTADEEIRKLLLNAVKMRLESRENSIITANMDSIISNILLLTNIQIKIIFSLCALKYFKIETNNFEEFKNNIEEIANEILLCDKITTVDLNGIVAHGFMVDDLLAMMWNSEIRLGHDMVQCNQKVFEENSFDISEHEKVSVLISSHFKNLYEASNIFTELNYKRLSCTYSGIILTDLIFSLKFPHIKHAHLEDILDSLK